MRKLLIGAVVAGGAVFALRRCARKGRKLRGHCRDKFSMVDCNEAGATPTA